jgi:hypothetical protein
VEPGYLTAVLKACRISGHAQAFFYRFDIRLHLPEMGCISRLDVFPQAFDIFFYFAGILFQGQ